MGGNLLRPASTCSVMEDLASPVPGLSGQGKPKDFKGLRSKRGTRHPGRFHPCIAAMKSPFIRESRASWSDTGRAAGPARGAEKKAARTPRRGDRAAGSSKEAHRSAEGVGGNHFIAASTCSDREL